MKVDNAYPHLKYRINSVVKLTKQLDFLSMQMYIFGRLRECLTTMGSVRERERFISLSISGGAEAVRAMKGALVSARRLPIF